MKQFKGEDGRKTEEVRACGGKEKSKKRKFRRCKPCRRQSQKSKAKRGRKRRGEGVSICNICKYSRSE